MSRYLENGKPKELEEYPPVLQARHMIFISHI